MPIPIRRVISILSVNLFIVLAGVLVLELFFGNRVKSDNLNRLSILRNRTLNYDVGSLYGGPDKTVVTREISMASGAHSTARPALIF